LLDLCKFHLLKYDGAIPNLDSRPLIEASLVGQSGDRVSVNSVFSLDHVFNLLGHLLGILREHPVDDVTVFTLVDKLGKPWRVEAQCRFDLNIVFISLSFRSFDVILYLCCDLVDVLWATGLTLVHHAINQTTFFHEPGKAVIFFLHLSIFFFLLGLVLIFLELLDVTLAFEDARQVTLDLLLRLLHHHVCRLFVF